MKRALQPTYSKPMPDLDRIIRVCPFFAIFLVMMLWLATTAHADSCVPVPTTVVDESGAVLAAPVVAGTSYLTVGNNSYISTGGAPLYTSGDGTSMTTTYGVGPPGQSLPEFSPPTFPTFVGTNKNVSNGTLVAGSYGTVTLGGSSTFSGGNYYISTLTAGQGVTLSLAAGDYFVNKWDVGANFALNVSSGPVRIFINSSFVAGNQSGFNVSGSTANLQIYAYDYASIQFGNANMGDSDIDFNGLVYAPGIHTQIEFGNNNVIQGSVLSAGTIDLGNNTGVIFDTATQAAIASISVNGVSCTLRFTVAKSFTPASVAPNEASVLTITLVNTSTIPVVPPVAGVAFSDIYPLGLVNTTPPGATTTCNVGTLTAAAGGGSLAYSGGMIPGGNSSCTVKVNVTSAASGTYLNSTGPVRSSNSADNTAGASATLTVGAVAPGTFNAFETSTAAGATIGNIYTKIAGTGFSLDVVAISGGAQDSSFNDTVKVELLGNTTIGVALDANNCPTSSTTLSSANAGIFGGRSTLSFAAVPNAWRDVRVRISYPANTPTVTSSCSTDNFAIRPWTITLIAQDADAQTAGTTRTLDQVVVDSVIFHKAGRPFKFLATAYNAAALSTSNYAGSPTMTLSACSGTACTSSFGTFTPGVTSFTSGTLSSITASYSEVGSFKLTLQDTDFASVDGGDTAASCGGRYVCGTASVGRFIPDHFDTAVTPGCGSFTYGGTSAPLRPGQSFATLQVTAKNSVSIPTVNYAGALAKVVTLSDANALGVGSLQPTTIAASAFVAGVAAPTLTYIFNSVTTPPATIALRALDTDAVSSSGFVEGSAEIRSGRAHMFNAYGSELLDLPVTFRTEYWAGTGWQLNSVDTCTNANLAFTQVGTPDITTCVLEPGNNSGQGCAVALTPTQTNRRYLETGVIGTDSNGVAGFAGNFNLWLRAPGANVRGSIDITATVDPWLQYLWPKPANPANLMPWGRATFGIYKSPLIYRRENY